MHSTIKAHDDVIKWKHFPRYWPFVRGIHGLPVNSPHKGQWRGALMFSLICAWMNGWVNNREAGDLRGHCAHYDVIVMLIMLTHCGLNKMIATKRTIFWNAFYTFSSTPNGSTGWQCIYIYIYHLSALYHKTIWSSHHVWRRRLLLRSCISGPAAIAILKDMGKIERYQTITLQRNANFVHIPCG